MKPPMKALLTVCLWGASLALAAPQGQQASTAVQTQQSEIEREIRQLSDLQERLTQKIDENRKLMRKIQKERDALNAQKAAFEKMIAAERNARYQSLAKVFEKMEPELAGDKISKIKDPRRAALIIHNMKTRSAGAVMNYVEPRRASTIVSILTDVKRPKK